ncbi:uncharacterized protein [Antedon mediterranea]|uniref:uncharacterized protein n=1 Tax=Antedon mediterranea TaxID=105859 RepID=UPI003AF9384D
MEEIQRLLDLYQRLAIESDHETEQASSTFVSKFKINCCPIIPPLMTDKKRKEMVAYRNLAVQKQEAIEKYRKQKLIDKVQAIVDTIDDKRTTPQETHDVSNLNLKPKEIVQLGQQSLQIILSSTEDDKHGTNVMKKDNTHESNTSIVILSTSGSELTSPVDGKTSDKPDCKILEQPSPPNITSDCLTPKEVVSSSSSGTDNSCLLPTVVPARGVVGQELDSITILAGDSQSSDNLSRKFPSVQDSLDFERVRESVSDSETLRNYLGEYSSLPTPGPSSTPDVSTVLSQNTRLNSDPLHTKLNDDTDEDKTADSVIVLTTESSVLDTLGQSCTLPISLVTESTCSTLYEVSEPWNMPHDYQTDLENTEGSTPTPSHVRRNSYTLDYPSPALLEAQAQNRAPHIQGQTQSKSARRVLDLSDHYRDSSQEPDEIISNQKASPDGQGDDFQSNIDLEIKSTKTESKDDFSKTKVQCTDAVEQAMFDAKGFDHESETSVSYLQQQMDLLETMQKTMMEEQQRQLRSLMEQQQLQQQKMHEEMAELEKQMHDRNRIESQMTVAEDQSSDHVGLDAKFVERSFLTNRVIDRSSSLVSDSTGYQARDHSSFSTNGDDRHNPKWKAPTIQNMKIHNDTPFNKVSAVTKGYLTRKLMKTDKVQSIIRTIKDMWQFIWQFQTETPVKRGVLSSSDTVLANRVFSQLRAAQFELHDIFFNVSVTERMAIIGHQRVLNLDKSKTNKEQGQKISAATRKAMERRQQIRTAEMKVFGRPQTAPPADYKHMQTSGKKGKSSLPNHKENVEDKKLRSLNKSVKVKSGVVSKTRSPSRNVRKTAHPFSRPMSAASRRSTQTSLKS